MSEIKNEVAQEIFHILDSNTDEHYQFKRGVAIVDIVEEILRIKSLAIVDRKAKLPKNPYKETKIKEQAGIVYREVGDSRLCWAYRDAQQDILKEGWGKIIE